MIETAENLAREYDISRDEADEFAARSQQRAAAAWADGRFADEVVPVSVPQRRGDPISVDRDEGVRGRDDPRDARQAAHGDAGRHRHRRQRQRSRTTPPPPAWWSPRTSWTELGLEPLGYLLGWAAAGCEPATMGIGPVPAVKKLFARTGHSFDQMDLVEVNEAFAVQVLAVLKGWGWNDGERLNVNGSGISLGHPVGATGRADHDHAAARAAPPRGQARAGDDVRRRRPGSRGRLRSGLKIRTWPERRRQATTRAS